MMFRAGVPNIVEVLGTGASILTGETERDSPDVLGTGADVLTGEMVREPALELEAHDEEGMS